MPKCLSRGSGGGGKSDGLSNAISLHRRWRAISEAQLSVAPVVPMGTGLGHGSNNGNIVTRGFAVAEAGVDGEVVDIRVGVSRWGMLWVGTVQVAATRPNWARVRRRRARRPLIAWLRHQEH